MTYTDRIPTPAEIQARRARLGWPQPKPVVIPVDMPMPTRPRMLLQIPPAPEPDDYRTAEPGAPIAAALKSQTILCKRQRRQPVTIVEIEAPPVLVTTDNIMAIGQRGRASVYTAAQRAIMTLEEVPLVIETTTQQRKAIVRQICAALGVSVMSVMSLSRNPTLTLVRNYIMWKLAKHTTSSFPDIGRATGRDHSTVIHAIRKINGMLGEDVRNLGKLK